MLFLKIYKETLNSKRHLNLRIKRINFCFKSKKLINN